MHENIRKDISSLREETKADTNALRNILSQKMVTLHETCMATATTLKEVERALSNFLDRIIGVEKADQTLQKDCNKLQEKYMDLENRNRRQNLRKVAITKHAERGNPSRFIAEFLSAVLGKKQLWISHRDSSSSQDPCAETPSWRAPQSDDCPPALLHRQGKDYSTVQEQRPPLLQGNTSAYLPGLEPRDQQTMSIFQPGKSETAECGNLIQPVLLCKPADNGKEH